MVGHLRRRRVKHGVEGGVGVEHGRVQQHGLGDVVVKASFSGERKGRRKGGRHEAAKRRTSHP